MSTPEIKELIEYLKESLTISINSEQERDYYSNKTRIEVKLNLDGETISSDSFTIDIK